jgi:hypothetical protein
MRTITALLAAAAAAAACPAIAAQQPNVAIAAAQDVDAALKAIAAIDSERIFLDKAYALQMLAHVEAVKRSGHYIGERKQHIDRLRLYALVGSRQLKPAFEQATELTRAAPGVPELHYFAFVLAVDTRSERALDELELADRSIVSDADRATFVELVGTEPVNQFRRPFYIAKDKAWIARSAKVLLNLGWPGPYQLDLTDSLKLDVAEGLLAKGDIAGAKRLVFTVQSTQSVLQMLVSSKWSSVRESGDPIERIAQAITASDEASERALRANPNDPEMLLGRAQFLRSVGKNAEALELLLPKANDLAWVKENDEDGFWVVNEAAYALVEAKREKDAVSLMNKLLSLGLEDNPELISMAINTVGIREDAGDAKGAADYAVTLATKYPDYASAYGDMWMWSGAACGHSAAGNKPAAQPWLAKLKAGEKDNPAALTRALLCADDIDGAAASVIRRLDGDDPDEMLIALQDYSVGADLPANKKILEARVRQVVARTDVQAAIARHGRVLKVPLSRYYWGMF